MDDSATPATITHSLESLPSLDGQLPRNLALGHTDVPLPAGSSPEENVQGCAANAAPDLVAWLEGQFAGILHEAFQKYSMAVDQQLQLLRGDFASLAALFHHSSITAAARPLDQVRKASETRSSSTDPAAMLPLPVTPRGPYQSKDKRTSEDEALPQEAPRGPAGGGSRRSSRRHSKPIDLRILESGLANELFEAQELHVPLSASIRRRKKRMTPSQSFVSDSTPKSDSSGLAMDKMWSDNSQIKARRDKTDRASSKRFAWCTHSPASSSERTSQDMSKEDSGRSSGSAEPPPLAVIPSSASTSPLHTANVNLDVLLHVHDRTGSDRTCSTEALRQFREAELTSKWMDAAESSLARKEYCVHFWAPLVLMRGCGALPWSTGNSGGARARASTLYQWAAAAVALLAFASCIEQAFNSTATTGVFMDVPLAVGSFFGLLSLGVHYNTKFRDCNDLLFSYADREGLLTEWGCRSCRELAAVLLNWTAAVLVQFAIMLLAGGAPSSRGVRSAVFFALSSLQLLGLAFGITHVCCGLTCMIDSFCCALVERRDLAEAAREWNVLQAVLRQACTAVERCFFIVQATLVSMILLSIADIIVSGKGALNMLALLPAGVVMLGITRIPFNAAAVTDKCARVPPLVNSLSFGHGQDFDVQRQHVVQYIINSVAGFYVFEVRLTSSMALKFLYVSCVCAFAVATKVISEWEK